MGSKEIQNCGDTHIKPEYLLYYITQYIDLFGQTVKHTCVCADMPLEVEGVIEALATERAKMPFLFAVALQVPVEHPLELEHLLAHLACVVSSCCSR